ncbi:MAG: hypothetical protein HY894_06140 [Deltaproteobacteria bacterium]|nr:hypothetical protein [Deltaproteobacteria bacterium]
MKKTFFFFAFAFSVASLGVIHPSEADAYGFISAEDVRSMQEGAERFLLVDARTAIAYRRKHIEGAINVPAFVVHKKGFPKDAVIVLYDDGIGSVEAGEAAGKLDSAGYASVFIMDGGMAHWESGTDAAIAAPQGVVPGGLVDFITAPELSRAAQNGTGMVIVDIRPAQGFKAGHVPGAVNVKPARVLRTSSGWAKDEPVVVVDGADNAGRKAAEELRRAGFKMVRILYGGFPEWKRQTAQ